MSGRRKRTLDELKNAPPEYLLTAHEVHLLTGLAENLVREAISSGELKSMLIGKGEELRVPRFRLRQWERDMTSAGERSIEHILKNVQ